MLLRDIPGEVSHVQLFLTLFFPLGNIATHFVLARRPRPAIPARAVPQTQRRSSISARVTHSPDSGDISYRFGLRERDRRPSRGGEGLSYKQKGASERNARFRRRTPRSRGCAESRGPARAHALFRASSLPRGLCRVVLLRPTRDTAQRISYSEHLALGGRGRPDPGTHSFFDAADPPDDELGDLVTGCPERSRQRSVCTQLASANVWVAQLECTLRGWPDLDLTMVI